MNAYGFTRSVDQVTFVFAAPTVPLSMNQARRLHWAAVRNRTNPWRDLLRYLTLANKSQFQGWLPPGGVTVQVDLPFRDARTRDPHNYTGTVVKAVVDGLTLGGLIPGDSPEWATILDSTISIQRDKTKPLLAKVTLRARS